MRAKDKAGDFRTDFDSYRWGRDYAEGVRGKVALLCSMILLA